MDFPFGSGILHPITWKLNLFLKDCDAHGILVSNLTHTKAFHRVQLVNRPSIYYNR